MEYLSQILGWSQVFARLVIESVMKVGIPSVQRGAGMNGRRMVAAGVVVAAVTVGGVAGALIASPGRSGASSSPDVSTSATSNSTPSAGGHVRGFRGGPGFGAGKDVMDAAAKALGLSTADLFKKLSDGKTTIADVAKAQNVDVQKVIDAMEAVANSQIQDIVNKPFPVPQFPGKGGHGKGPMMGGGPGMGFGFGFAGDLRGSIDSLSKQLGISSQDLLKDLGSGQSIADIAKAKGVDINTIINSLVTDATAKINAAVSDKHLSQDQATKIESGLKDMITKAVNGSFKFGGMGAGKGFAHGFGFGGPGGPGGPGGYPGGPAAPGAKTNPTTTVPAHA